MTSQVRLQDDVFSKGLETITVLTRNSGFTAELADKIRQKGGAERAVGALQREFFPEMPGSDVIWVGEVAVDYGVRPTYAELNGTWFDWVNEDFIDTTPELRKMRAKPLPTSGIVKHRYGYVCMNRYHTDKEALTEIVRRRVVPATDLEAMYFGKTFPDEQRKYSIVALRSFFRSGRNLNSAELIMHFSGRGLHLDRDSVFSPRRAGDRFLVREDSE